MAKNEVKCKIEAADLKRDIRDIAEAEKVIEGLGLKDLKSSDLKKLKDASQIIGEDLKEGALSEAMTPRATKVKDALDGALKGGNFAGLKEIAGDLKAYNAENQRAADLVIRACMNRAADTPSR